MTTQSKVLKMFVLKSLTITLIINTGFYFWVQSGTSSIQKEIEEQVEQIEQLQDINKNTKTP